MYLNAYGTAIRDIWNELPDHFPNVHHDTYIIMPDHVHAIIRIGERGGEERRSGETPPLRTTLGQVVAYWKYQSTKLINILRGTPGVCVWQRNFYESILRKQEYVNVVREYIKNNPENWNANEST